MTTPTPNPTTVPDPRDRSLAGVLRRLPLRLGLAMLTVCGLSVLAVGPATAADTCANAGLREQNNSTELPECRAYELASSPYKEGFDLIPQTLSDDGIVSYGSTGSFAGNGYGAVTNQYLGVRTPTGWETQSIGPPKTLFDVPVEDAFIMSSDLRSSIWSVIPRDQPGGGTQVLYRRDLEGKFTRIGEGPGPDGPEGLPLHVSDDLSHVVFTQGFFGGSLWEYVGHDGDAAVRHVSIDNNGQDSGGACPGGQDSADGRVIVFCAGMAVWARVGGSATVAVSGSQCTRTFAEPGGVCNAPSQANYAGSATDGSRVFFTTAQQLVNGDTDQTTDLYACDIPPGSPAPVGVTNPCAALTEVSGATVGARVEGVAAVSEDGSRVYFLAQGVLAENLGAGDVGAVAGQQNLYLWTKDAAHPAGQTTFVAGAPGLTLNGPQTVMDGRYLVFSTTAPLVSSGPGADTDGAADMYRYDAETGSMLRLSTSVTGSGGNEPGLEATLRAKAVSADGSMVLFETAEALSPQDTDGVADVYLWHDGRVSLISHGGGQALWISSTGQDIYFLTAQRLTVADGDTSPDIYDARVGGGFDLTQSVPCSGDACQGPLSTPPASGTPSSETLQGTGNLPQPAVNATPRPISRPLTAQQKLAKAMKACSKRPKHKRAACKRQARKRYGPVKQTAAKSTRGSHR